MSQLNYYLARSEQNWFFPLSSLFQSHTIMENMLWSQNGNVISSRIAHGERKSIRFVSNTTPLQTFCLMPRKEEKSKNKIHPVVSRNKKHTGIYRQSARREMLIYVYVIHKCNSLLTPAKYILPLFLLQGLSIWRRSSMGNSAQKRMQVLNTTGIPDIH